MIITPEMIERAIGMARFSVETILSSKEFTWGPQYVGITVIVPGLMHTGVLGAVPSEWNPEWGEERDFAAVAGSKARAAFREKMDTGLMLEYPWLFEPGEYLYPGGIYFHGMAVGVSGAMGIPDEAIARMIATNLAMLAKMRAKEMIAAKQPQIPDPHQGWRV